MGPELSKSAVLLRYIYEGGKLGRDSRLTSLELALGVRQIFASQVLRALKKDGVDFLGFYVTAFESTESGGSWLPIQKNETSVDVESMENFGEVFLLGEDAKEGRRQRIDLKLFRRAPPPPSKKLKHEGYFGVGIVGVKNEFNIGSLWRSAFQLGAAYIFTVGGRIQKQATDTLVVPKRIPSYEYDAWSDFLVGTPKGTQLVAVEFGGEPLESFVHPLCAAYILGSEDTGLPESVVLACQHHVTLPSLRYESFNVAMAGSIIMYDRLAKQQLRDPAGMAAAPVDFD
jgi:tRNA(Leu) C34 or U34 (ribose-2'-O)-methylase TrmL